MVHFTDVKKIVEKIATRLPNINLEGKLSLSFDELQALIHFNLTSDEQEQIDEQELAEVMAIISAVQNKYQYAQNMIQRGLNAHDQGQLLEEEEIYRDFSNEYLTWFQPECFPVNGTKFFQGIANPPEMAEKNSLCLEKIIANHRQVHTSEDFKDVVVIGAGPTGLMAALKLYESGARVTLVEARAKFHTRKQAVVLDPSIMADLRHYLGNEYKTLFAKGHIYPDGRGHIAIGDYEKALYNTLVKLSEKDGANLRIIPGHAASKILPPDETHAKFRVSLDGKEDAIDCDYIYSAEGGRNSFSGKTHILGQANKAKVDLDKTPNTYITMLYDIKEDEYKYASEPVQGAKIPKNITQIRDKLKLAFEQQLMFFYKCNQMWEDSSFASFFSAIKNDPQGIALNRAFAELRVSDFLSKEIDLRTFETRGQFYIATEVPPPFHQVMEILHSMSKRTDVNQAVRDQALALQKKLQDEWSSLLSRSKFKFLDDERVQIDYNTSLTFQVTPQGTSLAARILKKGDKQLMILAGGDLFRAPHFYSGSGISSSHAGVNAFQRYFANIQAHPEEETSIKGLFLAEMQHIAKFVDGKMGEYCQNEIPLLPPVKISISEVGSEALEIDALINDIQEHTNSLRNGLSAFGIIRTLFQGLRQQKVDIFEGLLVRLNDCKNYTDLQAELTQVTEEHKSVLGRHRYSLWSRSGTKSEQFLSTLQARAEVAKDSERTQVETPDIKALYQVF